MNGLGIDYQQTLTLLALREGPADQPRTRLVDDGSRLLIPHAVSENGLWGSRAFQAQPADWLRSADRLPAGPWLEEAGTRRFWECLYQRSWKYLGRVEPLPREGYQVVIAIPSAPEADEPREVQRHAESAGFFHAEVIPATDALLCRWLAAPGRSASLPQTVVAVAVTDCAVCVSAYALGRSRSDGLPGFNRGGWLRLDDLGFQAWYGHFLEEIRRHMTESPSADEELLLRDGAVELATRLRTAGRTEALEWTGPLHERCFSKVTFSPVDCQNWPSANRLALELPSAVQQVLRPFGAPARADLIVVGGLGAVWPFVADVASRLGPTWCGSTPVHDIALGAAWWPILGRRCIDASAFANSELPRLPAPPQLALTPSPFANETILDPMEPDNGDLIPPWKRDQ